MSPIGSCDTNDASIELSVVIPHLNQTEFLERCLHSLSTQASAPPNTEIIVVDNGSYETPEAVCTQYPIVRLAKEPKPGPGPARNHGISIARGKLLSFIDADCKAHENWLFALRREFATNPETMIIGGDVRIDPANSKQLTSLEAYESVFAYRQKEYIEKYGFSGTGNLAMRREAYSLVGPFSGIELAEDRDWGRRAIERGFRIKYVSDMIVYHPARKTLAELKSKWDRHISHDYNEKGRGRKGDLQWAARAIAVAASSVVDIHKVIISDRLGSWRERVIASAVLFKIRIYRAIQMLKLTVPDVVSSYGKWNRQ
jgi:glycosyltransferase involved in cell wall biosynthesis